MAERRRTRLQQLARWFSQSDAEGERREFGVLRAHFFRSFFDNDTLSLEGDMVTATAQAMMLAALPSAAAALLVMIAMLRALPLGVGNVYDALFATYSFAGLGLLMLFKWEMLFADRADFLILSPLPLRRREMLGAKVAALVRYTGMFLLAANALSTLLVPGAAGHWYPTAVLAHAISVGMAGSFGVLLVVAVHAVLLCVMRGAWLRRVLPAVQAAMVAALVWMLADLPLYGVAAALPRRVPGGMLQWLPPLWFTGIYDELLLRGAAPPLVRTLALRGTCAVLLSAVVVAMLYPLAWRRRQAMALEDAAGKTRPRLLWMEPWLTWEGGRQESRAMFAFVGQTLRRNQRYQTYLMLYGGVGLGIAGIWTIQVVWGRTAEVAIDDGGLYILMPLLLFWLVVGLRAAFAMPVEMGANWVFPMCGVELGRCAATARRWVELHALGLALVVLAVLRARHWDGTRLLVQAVCGVSLAMVLTEVLFALRRGVPFTRPRLPGKSNVAIAVALYIGVLPQFLPNMMTLERWLETRLGLLWIPLAVAVALRLGVRLVERRREPVFELLEEEMEGTLVLRLDA